VDGDNVSKKKWMITLSKNKRKTGFFFVDQSGFF